jgi:hypothetical protein
LICFVIISFFESLRGEGELTIHLTDASHYSITLLLATGSDAHLAGLHTLAAERKMTLDHRGPASPRQDDRGRREGRHLRGAWQGSRCRPSSARAATIARALAGALPELISDADVAGVLHVHTECSDGVDTLGVVVALTEGWKKLPKVAKAIPRARRAKQPLFFLDPSTKDRPLHGSLL